jgi:hypothetical protein
MSRFSRTSSPKRMPRSLATFIPLISTSTTRWVKPRKAGRLADGVRADAAVEWIKAVLVGNERLARWIKVRTVVTLVFNTVVYVASRALALIDEIKKRCWANPWSTATIATPAVADHAGRRPAAQRFVDSQSLDEQLEERSRLTSTSPTTTSPRPTLPPDASGPPNPMSTVSMTSPRNRRDTVGHRYLARGRLRLGTPPTLVPIEKPLPVVGLRWVGVRARRPIGVREGSGRAQTGREPPHRSRAPDHFRRL